MTIARTLKKSSLVALTALSAACSNTYTPHGIGVDNICVEKFGDYTVFVDMQGPKGEYHTWQGFKASQPLLNRRVEGYVSLDFSGPTTSTLHALSNQDLDSLEAKADSLQRANTPYVSCTNR